MTDTQPGTGPTKETRSAVATGELVYDNTPVPPGRRVRLEPTPPGFWRLVLGAVVALLGPFFGILVGSSMGSADAASRMDPLYWGFFIGGIIGALAILVAASGGAALFRHSRARTREDEL